MKGVNMINAAWMNVTGRDNGRTAKEVSFLHLYGVWMVVCSINTVSCVGRQRSAAAIIVWVCLDACLCLSLSGMKKSRWRACSCLHPGRLLTVSALASKRVPHSGLDPVLCCTLR